MCFPEQVSAVDRRRKFLNFSSFHQMMFNFKFLLTLVCLLFPAVVQCLNVIETAFMNDTDHYHTAVTQMFRKFDSDYNGHVDSRDFNHTAMHRFHTNFMQDFDSDSDGTVTEVEFTQRMDQHAHSIFDINSTLCLEVKQSRMKCLGTVESSPKIYSIRVKTIQAICDVGISALEGYSLEKCILSAHSCQQIADCYTDPTSKDFTIHKRSQELLKRTAFWLALLVIGTVMLPALLLLPFWILAYIIGRSDVAENNQLANL